MMKTAPQIEAEAAQLNRDYAIHKKNYEDLVTRRESAAMSGELEGASGVADFRLIDPPRVSPTPVSPNRFLLLAACVRGGHWLPACSSHLRAASCGRCFTAPTELRSKVAIPLLGVVSNVRSGTEARLERVSLIRFVAGSGGLLGLFIVVFVALSIMAARRVG